MIVADAGIQDLQIDAVITLVIAGGREIEVDGDRHVVVQVQ